MPGIKPADAKLADLRLNRFSLAALALLFSQPAAAGEHLAGIEPTERQVDAPQAANDEEAPDRTESLETHAVPKPANDAEVVAGIRIMEWDDGTASGTVEDETPAEAAYDDVWQRVRDGFGIGEDAFANPLVGIHESWFAARPESVQRLVERARPYLFYIVEELERREMPMEIALLPMIESAFNPTALSPAAASGIWQFIPSTGRRYGLRQDTWYDGRRDFTAATRAALDYLGKLYLDFGDWQLALAAYNCGEGCVARAIRRNAEQDLPTDYASLPLPFETRHYVPKLLAVRSLIDNPERYGIAVDALPNEPYFDQVTVHASMDIHSAARLADMSSDEFFALNAAFQRKLIRSDTPVSLLVPVAKADAFQRNLESGEWDTWKPYAARKGESPRAIAKRFGVSLARLEEHNQLKLKRGKLARAQTILVPVKRRAAAGTQGRAGADARHVVKRGDTLFGVARHYGVSVAQLTEANLGLDIKLRVGQVIYLPLGVAGSDETVQAASVPGGARQTRPAHYTIKRGDNLSAIAQRFEISLADLKAWNPDFRKTSTIRPGQTVIVRKP